MGVIYADDPATGWKQRFHISGDQPSETEMQRIQQWQSSRAPAPAPIAAPAPEFDPSNPPGTQLSRGIKSGIGAFQQLMGEAAEGAGLEGLGQNWREAGIARQQEVEKYRTRLEDVEGIRTGGRWAGEVLGEQLPIMAPTMAGTFLGGAAGGAALGSVAPGIGTAIGAMAGGALASLPLLFGGNRAEQRQADIEAGRPVEIDDRAALLAALPQAALEGVAGKIIGYGFRPIGGTGLFTRTISRGAEGALAEIPTEIGQEIIQIMQAGGDPTSDESVKRLIEAGLTAGVIGGGLGGTFGALGGTDPNPATDTPSGRVQFEEDRAIEQEEGFDRIDTARRAVREDAVPDQRTAAGQATISEGLERGRAAQEADRAAQAEAEGVRQARVEEASRLRTEPLDPMSVQAREKTKQDMLERQIEMRKQPSTMEILARRKQEDRAKREKIAVDTGTKQPREGLEERATKEETRRSIELSRAERAAEVETLPFTRLRGKKAQEYGWDKEVRKIDVPGGPELIAFREESGGSKIPARSWAVYDASSGIEAAEYAGENFNDVLSYIARNYGDGERQMAYQWSETARTGQQGDIEFSPIRPNPEALTLLENARASVEQRVGKELGLGEFSVNMQRVLEPESIWGDEVNLIEGREKYENGRYLMEFATDVYGSGLTPEEAIVRIGETANHEAIHGFRSLGLFTAPEWQSLGKAARNLKFVRRDGDKREYTYFDKSNWELGDQRDQQYIEEEAVANMFRDWAAGRLKLAGRPQSLFRRIMKALRGLFNSAQDQNVESVAQLFDAIESGSVGRRERGSGEVVRPISPTPQNIKEVERHSALVVKTRAFRNWFGNSKIVDSNGDPMVLYHGTKRDFVDFKPAYDDGLIFFTKNPEFAAQWPVGTGGMREPSEETKALTRSMKEYEDSLAKEIMTADTSSPEFMRQYEEVKRLVKERFGDESRFSIEDRADIRVMPVFLRANKPFDPRKDYSRIEPLISKIPEMAGVMERGLHRSGNWVIYERKDVIDAIKEMGYDAIYLAENIGGPHETVAAFYPDQIRSVFSFNSKDDGVGVSSEPIEATPENIKDVERHSALVLQTRAFKDWANTNDGLDIVVNEDGSEAILYRGVNLDREDPAFFEKVDAINFFKPNPTRGGHYPIFSTNNPYTANSYAMTFSHEIRAAEEAMAKLGGQRGRRGFVMPFFLRGKLIDKTDQYIYPEDRRDQQRWLKENPELAESDRMPPNLRFGELENDIRELGGVPDGEVWVLRDVMDTGTRTGDGDFADIIVQKSDYMGADIYVFGRGVDARPVYSFSDQDSARESSIKLSRDEAFSKMADIQRGTPEMRMLDVQDATGGGVVNWAVEHIGDLTHRMGEYGGKLGREFVEPKVRRGLRMLRSEYGFRREHEENLRNSARYRGVSVEEQTAKVNSTLREYAKAHREVPVYNELQRAARDAAIMLGEGRFEEATSQLEILERALDDGSYESRSMEYDQSFEGAVTEEVPPNISGTPVERYSALRLGASNAQRALSKATTAQMDSEVVATVKAAHPLLGKIADPENPADPDAIRRGLYQLGNSIIGLNTDELNPEAAASLQDYADLQAEVPVFNYMQWQARAIPIAMAEGDLVAAKKHTDDLRRAVGEGQLPQAAIYGDKMENPERYSAVRLSATKGKRKGAGAERPGTTGATISSAGKKESPRAPKERPEWDKELIDQGDGLQYARAARLLESTIGVFGWPFGKQESVKRFVEDAVQKFQDGFLPFAKLIDDIRAAGGKVSNLMDVYMKEELLTGKIGALLGEQREMIYKPFLNRIGEIDLTADQIQSIRDASDRAAPNEMGYVSEAIENFRSRERGVMERLMERAQIARSDKLALADAYLYALHAKERNAWVRKRDPDNNAGSGMTDAEADAILKAFGRLPPPKRKIFNDIASLQKTIIKDTNRQQKQVYGLQSEDIDSGWNHYAPLRGKRDPDGFVEDSGTTTHQLQTIGAAGRENRRITGRSGYPTSSLVVESVVQNQRAITRGERNEVGKSLLKLIREFPEETRQWMKIVDRPTQKVAVGDTIRRMPLQWFSPEDQMLTVKENGEEVYVKMLDHRFGRAVGLTMDPPRMGYLMQKMAGFNRFLANVNTSWNPEFVLSNLPRDIETAMVNAQQYDAGEIGRDILKNSKTAFSAVKHVIRGTEDKIKNPKVREFAESFKELRSAGGINATNMTDTLESLEGDLDRLMAEINNTNSTADAVMKGRKAIDNLFKFVEDYNTVVENMTRLAFYKAVRDRGADKERAAQATRNLTTNFAKGGELKAQANAMYLFYNASLQGTWALLRGLARSSRVRKAWAGVVGMGFMLDMANAMMSEEDDDGILIYDKIYNYDLEHNLILMDPTGTTDRGYVKLPFAYGLNLALNTGRVMSRFMRGGYEAGEAADSFKDTFLEFVWPLGGQESIMNAVAPTTFDPVIDILENEDYAGNPIYREPSQWGSSEPAAYSHWTNTGMPYQKVAKTINDWTGGNEVRPGMVDWSPDVIQYLTEYIFGATGATIGRLTDTLTSTVPEIISGEFEEDTLRTIPMSRRLLSTITKQQDVGKFFEKTNEVNTARNELVRALELGDEAWASEVREKYADELRIYGSVRSLMNARNKVKRQLNAIEDNPRIPEDQKRLLKERLEDRLQEIVARGNELMKDI